MWLRKPTPVETFASPPSRSRRRLTFVSFVSRLISAVRPMVTGGSSDMNRVAPDGAPSPYPVPPGVGLRRGGQARGRRVGGGPRHIHGVAAGGAPSHYPGAPELGLRRIRHALGSPRRGPM